MRARRGWRVALGVDGYEMKRAFLRWPSLLALHQPAYVLAWQAESFAQLTEQADAVGQIEAHAQTFKAFRWPLYLLALALLVILPLSLFATRSDVLRLAAVILVYLCTIWLSLLALRHGRHGHSAKGQARSIALQVLFCPPFALNIVRKLSLLQKFSCTLPQAAYQLLDKAQWQELAERLHQLSQTELDEIRELHGASSAPVQRLESACTTLRTHIPQSGER